MKKKPEGVVKNQVQRKEFSYTLEDTRLSFTLRVDNTSELRPFLKLLATAQEDIQKEIDGLKN